MSSSFLALKNVNGFSIIYGTQTECSYLTSMKGFLKKTQKDLSCFFNVVFLNNKYQLKKILLLITGLMLIVHFLCANVAAFCDQDRFVFAKFGVFFF